jgi:AbrB family looped-hinge helix DNA binding protein
LDLSVKSVQAENTMSLVRVLRGGQVTLPAETRKALKLSEGDYLEAEVREGALVLKPVADRERGAAWEKLLEIVDKDKWVRPEPRPNPRTKKSRSTK